MSSLVVIVALITTVVVLNVDHADAAVPKHGKGRGYSKQEYMAARLNLLSKDEERALGAKLVLNEKEQMLDSILLKVSQMDSSISR